MALNRFLLCSLGLILRAPQLIFTMHSAIPFLCLYPSSGYTSTSSCLRSCRRSCHTSAPSSSSSPRYLPPCPAPCMAHAHAHHPRRCVLHRVWWTVDGLNPFQDKRLFPTLSDAHIYLHHVHGAPPPPSPPPPPCTLCALPNRR
ncbi:hypothetical protein JB92DRAFT_2985048 [Gautieria morchelliformis]|nr:hypothetical protein JB92DRAFT_2985048 [Gautieria morchelliformis]